MPEPNENPYSNPPLSGVKRVLAAIAACVYVLTLLSRPPGWVPGAMRGVWEQPRAVLLGFLSRLVSPLGEAFAREKLQYTAFFFVTSLAVPWIVLALAGRGAPRHIGLRWPNRLGWRWLLLAFALAAPFIIWMVESPAFGPYYERQLRSGHAMFLAYMVTVMITEHFLFHGALLAWFRPGFTWPPAPPLAAGGRHRLLRWLGLAQPAADDETGRLASWFGLRAHCIMPILLSGLLFGAVHFTKDPRELLLSFPGGIALAYLAYRTNSALIPLLLHMATAGLAYVVLLRHF